MSCALLGGFSKQAAIDENLDGTQAELSLASIGKGIMNYLAGSMTPMIPVLLAAGLFKTVGAVLGPSMLGIMAADSDLVRCMDMIYSAAFYFMPIYLGFNAAKQIGLTPILGAFLGGMLIEPSFTALAAEGTGFSIYGFLPCAPGSYAQTVLPILLTIPVAYAIERFMRKHMPDALQTVFVPFLTLGITIPVSFCLLAPAGSWLGNGLAGAFEFLGTSGGIVSVLGAGVLAAAWLPMVITGMHVALIGIAQVAFLQAGFDPFIFVAITISLWPAFGAEIAAFLRLKLRDEKSACAGLSCGTVNRRRRRAVHLRYGFPLSQALPLQHGGQLCLRSDRTRPGCHGICRRTSLNLLSMLTFVGGGTENLLFACIAAAAGFAVSFVATWLFGFTKDELENGPVSERD